MIEHQSLQFYPLTFVAEKSSVTIGRLDTDTYADFPPDGAALLHQLQAGLAPQEAALWYQQHYGETVDMDDFLATLRDLQFLRDDEGQAEPVESARAKTKARWQWLGRAIFSPFAWVLYGALFVAALYAMLRFPQLRPATNNVFVSQYATLTVLILFLGQFPALLFHEAYHMLAGRRLGLSSRLSIGRRLIFIVFETSLSGLWSVPRRSRYLPFLAGMLADVIWFSALTLLASLLLLPGGGLSPLGGVCLGLAFTTLLRLQWQFYFYLRTDLYYVFTHATGCVDLHSTTQAYLRNFLFRLLGRSDKMEDPAVWHPRDYLIARWYAPCYLLGCILTIGVVLFITIPIVYRFLVSVTAHLLLGAAVNGTQFWDSALFLFLNGAQFLLIAVLYLHERKKRVAAQRTSI